MSDIPDLLKRLRTLGTHTLKEDWKKGKRCPECGVSSERPNCAIDAGGYCQAHDQRYYKLSSDDYVFKADGHAQAAAALIEKQQGEIKRLRKALEEIARQKLHAEITDSDPDELDWLGGYEVCVKRARSAIAETAP